MSGPASSSERDLLIQLKAGNQAAFEQLYHAHKQNLIGHLIRLLKSPDLAREVAQDTFLALWENREQLLVDQPLKPYLFKIASNQTFNIFKKASHDEKYRNYLYQAIEDGYEHIESLINEKEKKEVLQQILEKMPLRQRDIFQRCKLDGQAYKEVAAELNISVHTVHTQVKRANQFIKDYLAKHPELLLFLLFSVYP